MFPGSAPRAQICAVSAFPSRSKYSACRREQLISRKAACLQPLLCRVIFTVLGVFFFFACLLFLSFWKRRFPARFCVCFLTKDAAFPAAPISSTVSQQHQAFYRAEGKQLENAPSLFTRSLNTFILDATFFLHIYGALIIILKG